MRIVLLLTTLLLLAVTPALAQNGQGYEDGPANGNASSNARSNGNGGNNGNGNGGNNGQGNGNGNGNGNGPGSANGEGSNGQNNRTTNGDNGRSGRESSGHGNGQGQVNGRGNSGIRGVSPEAYPRRDSDATVRYDQDYARDAVNAGRAVSLASLLSDLQARTSGEVIDAELLRVQGMLIYSIKVLRTSGHVTQEYYYAQSGRFIGSEP
jgi:hypothetical protein